MDPPRWEDAQTFTMTDCAPHRVDATTAIEYKIEYICIVGLMHRLEHGRNALETADCASFVGLWDMSTVSGYIQEYFHAERDS